MKKVTAIISSLLLLASMQVTAQSWLGKIGKRVKEKVVEKVEQHIDDKTDETTGKVLDKAETLGKKTGKKGEQQTSTLKGKSNNGKPAVAGLAETDAAYLKYDFVPGSEIIFEDNLAGEQNGEFPGKWDLVQGNFENASFDGSNVIYHIKCNMNGGGGIVPMLKNAKADYLPEEFTIEFDAYFTENHGGNYVIYFGDYKNQAKLDKEYPIGKKWIRIAKNSVEGENFETNYYPGYKSGVYDKTPKWRHVAISFNKRALKVYLDDARVLNIPNLGYNPTGFSIGKQSVEGKDPGYTKNFRIAKGAVPLYDKILSDGKFVTTGIQFDVNKATIKSESAGTINYVVKMMQDHPELKFSVEGHTDSDGDNASNQTLSQKRAEAVKNALVKQGIGAERLTSKGWGETKPMAGNDTPEGKAQNRRVEFVKQ